MSTAPLRTIIIFEPADVERRLAELDVTQSILVDSILYGDAEARSCTDNDPSLLRGILRWGRTNRCLAELLAEQPFGWRREEDLGYPTTVHPSKRWSIAVQTGNEHTANPKRTPTTKYPRGPVTRRVIALNAQMELFNSVGKTYRDLPEVADIEKRTTWLLLVAVEGEVIKAELSAPLTVDEDGRPNDYSERIILPSIDRGTRIGRIEEPPTEFDVNVRRHGDA